MKTALESIGQPRAIEGVRGVHLMAVEWEDVIPRIAKDAGLLPRPGDLAELPARGTRGAREVASFCRADSRTAAPSFFYTGRRDPVPAVRPGHPKPICRALGVGRP